MLQAAVLGKGGEAFVLDMGEPVKIVDLARDLIDLSGLEVGRDIDIVFTGMRPGEKLFEELFVPGEDYQRTTHDKIFIANNASRLVPDGLDQSIDELTAVAVRGDGAAITRGLQGLIPEFRPLDGGDFYPASDSPNVRDRPPGNPTFQASLFPCHSASGGGEMSGRVAECAGVKLSSDTCLTLDT